MSDIEERRKVAEEKFTSLQKELEAKTKEFQEFDSVTRTELLKLQGEYRLLTELIEKK